MTEAWLEVLKSYEGLEYTVREVLTHRAERYNVKQETEMNRCVQVRHVYLTVYKVFEEEGSRYRGSCATEIHPTATEAEMREIIEDGLFAAGFVKNAYYPLPGKSESEEAPVTEFAPVFAQTPEVSLEALQEAFYKHDSHKDGNLSYGEIFVTQSRTRIINSNGVDATYTSDEVYAETAVHWRSEAGETEITQAFRFSGTDTAPLADSIRQLFTIAEQKSKAIPTPKLTNIPVLLTGECLREFFSYYHAQTDAQYAYRGLSVLTPGDSVQGTDIQGDRLTLVLEPQLPGSTHSKPYDQSGLSLTKHTIIEQGKMIKNWGSTRFAYYLGTEPTGDITNYVIMGGTATDSTLRAEPYLELVSFSDFQTNPITGDFGSEIRLGFYFDGEKTIPVTGGSISGNIKQVQSSMRMSETERQYNYYRGPATVWMTGVTIAGV